MNDSYQAVYDAVRSRFSGCDVAAAIRDGVHLDGSFAIHGVAQEAYTAIAQVQESMTAPSAIYRPRIGLDGNQWCALYGDNLQDGVAGFGDTPAAAMADFDRNWNAPIPQRPTP